MSTGQIETIDAVRDNTRDNTGHDSLAQGNGHDHSVTHDSAQSDAPTEPSKETKPNITYLLLIRHGENEWVASKKLAGRTLGVFLNERGKQQSNELVPFLAKQPIRAIYSSPLERCIETAQPLASELGLPILPEAGLIEVDYGEWRGADLRDLGKLPEWKLVQHYPGSFRFPGGETLYEVQARALQTLEQLRARHPNEVIVAFSHGDVIRLSIAHLMGVPLDLFQRTQISTASVSVIVFHNTVPSVLSVNSVVTLPIFETKSES